MAKHVQQESGGMETIVHNVLYVRQSLKKDCWAAAAAMVLGRSVGPGAAKVDKNGGLKLDEENLKLFANSHGLKILPMRTYTPKGLAEILRKGPLLVGGKFKQPGGHAYVIAGIKGDMILVLDPSTRAKKPKGWIPYRTLMTEFPYAAAIMMQKK